MPGEARLPEASAEALEGFEATVAQYHEAVGFFPNSLRIMAHRPEILAAFTPLVRAVYGTGTVPPHVKALVALMASAASGCQYCQAHTAQRALGFGAPDDAVEELWTFEQSDRFTAGEKAAFRLARDAAQVPNQVTDAHFEELREHFSVPEVVEILSVISLFGWLNRWNDTLATPLEDSPLAVGEQHLASRGWDVGKHAAARASSGSGDPQGG